jgi:hypothetical protein
MTTLPQGSSTNTNDPPDGLFDKGDRNRSGISEPPLEFVLAPKQTDARRRFAYIGASVAAALMIGYLSGSSVGLRTVRGEGIRIDQVELPQALSPNPEVTTDASDEQRIAGPVNKIDALQAQIERVRQSADNLHASERLRALEAVREESVEAGKTDTALIARLDKLETRLAQLERDALNRDRKSTRLNSVTE